MSKSFHSRLVAGLVSGVALLTGPSVCADASFHVTPLTARHTLSPGAVIRGRLLVVNTGEQDASYTVRVKDFVTDVAGADSWSPVPSHPRALGDWLRFSPSELTIPAGGEGFVEYEIQGPGRDGLDPAGAVPAGSYWAAIQIQSNGRVQAARPARGQRASRFGIKVGFVYAIKIYVDIDGTEAPSLQAVGLQAGAEAGSLVATFDNTGNVVLKPRVWMEIRDQEGGVLATLNSLRWTLQPGRGHRYGFSIRDIPERLPDGRYQVVVIADHGGPRLLGLTAPLQLDGGARR